MSAAPALFTVQTALLGEREASDVVLPLAPLGEMHGDAAGAALREQGAVIRTGERVAALEDGAVVLGGRRAVEADAGRRRPAAGGERAPARGAGSRLEDSPIVSAHLLFDRPILGFELAALLGSPAHWVFDRGALTGHRPRAGQYLTVVSSGAPGAARGARPRASSTCSPAS